MEQAGTVAMIAVSLADWQLLAGSGRQRLMGEGQEQANGTQL